MAWNVVPLETYPDQVIHVTVPAQNKQNVQLILHLRYNTEGGFWRMDISDSQDNMLVSGAPLLTGEYPAANILQQFDYLGIGSAIILNMTEATDADIPGLSDLGTDFVLIWGDSDVDE